MDNITKKIGIGLRSSHHIEILKTKPNIGWLEIHTENFFADGGPTIEFLEQISEIYPLSFHGVSLSLGSADPLNMHYLDKLKSLTEKFNPFLISEHLSWTAYNGVYTHDLLPMPYNKATLTHISNKIKETQDFLGRKILIENPSSYFSFKNSNIPEDEFLNALAHTTKCGVLLDVNNLYVSSFNNKTTPDLYKIEKDYINEIHLAGHSVINLKSGTPVIIDTHSDFICDQVWNLYKKTISYAGLVPTLIEWDRNVPSLQTLVSEANKAEIILNKYYNESQSCKNSEKVH